MSSGFEEVAAGLGLGAEHRVWEEAFEQSEALLDDADPLPQGRALAGRCRELRVPESLIEPVVGGAAAVERDPHLRRLLAHGRWLLREQVPRVGPWLTPWVPLPTRLGDVGRLFHAYAFLADVPRVRRRHAELGVDDRISEDTLSDLGLNLGHFMRTWDRPGFDEPGWMGHHFTGQLFRVGRLQYQLGTWWVPTREPCEVTSGAPILDIHIPDIGPLVPGACDDSIAAAREFFARCLPSRRYDAFGCWSWLLDRSHADYLPPAANIRLFQARFQMVPTETAHDGQALKFVFRKPPGTPLDVLPQRTRLERAVVAHVRAGRTWNACLGYFR